MCEGCWNFSDTSIWRVNPRNPEEALAKKAAIGPEGAFREKANRITEVQPMVQSFVVTVRN